MVPLGKVSYPMEAIHISETAALEVIIRNSISQCWEGSGGILDIHNIMTGNSSANWGKFTPMNNAFVQTILHSPFHVLATIISKRDFVLSDKNGKMVSEIEGFMR